MISIKNQPGRRSDTSIAYAVTARIDYFDRKDKHIMQVRCGHWTKEAPQAYFENSGKKKRCGKIDFYTHDTWYLPLVYELTGDDMIYAYDHSSAIKSKKVTTQPFLAKNAICGKNIFDLHFLAAYSGATCGIFLLI